MGHFLYTSGAAHFAACDLSETSPFRRQRHVHDSRPGAIEGE
jgi:hypothetical protein